MATETPKYRVVETEKNLEVRDYPALVVAEVTVQGEREAAANAAFRPLANYIFGGNAPKEKIGMTAPVTQTKAPKGETIGMTAPVTQVESGTGWVVRFIMPARYTLETLPAPTDPNIRLEAVPSKRFAVIRFSGFAEAASLSKHLDQLRAYIAKKQWKEQGAPTYAFYDPPWTLPFMRRNEIMIEIAS